MFAYFWKGIGIFNILSITNILYINLPKPKQSIKYKPGPAYTIDFKIMI